MNPLAQFVVINFHGAESVRAMMASLQKQTCEAWSLTVVDNSENDHEMSRLDMLSKGEPRAQVRRAPKNLGYFGSAHWWCTKSNPTASQWTVICNADLELEATFVDRLIATDYGQFVTAPSILSVPAGVEQNPYMTRRPSTAAMFVRAAVFQWAPLTRVYQRASLVRPRSEVGPAREIYAAHGAILPISSRYFQAGATLAHAPFLFNEELTVAEAVRAVGGRIRFEPSLRVRHHEHQATSASPRTHGWQREASVYGLRLIRGGLGTTKDEMRRFELQ